LLTAAEVQSFVPSRGRFTFPAPYGTEGVRLTNSSDCAGGTDCVLSVGYSYWRNINNHAGSNTMLVLVTLVRSRGGVGPSLFSYDKTTGTTRNLGPLFPSTSPHSWATGEGWYFSATQPNTLYLNNGPAMLRYDVIQKTFSTVFDVTAQYGANRYIWQIHTSQDDLVHSFTLRDSGSSAVIGCGVYLESTRQFRLFQANGGFDECQIDKSGRYLVVKENVDGAFAEENVIHDLATGTQTVLLDQNGALGHSDLGFSYGVGEDNWNSLPAAVRVWEYNGGLHNGRLVFHATDWAFGSNHVAHSNARAGVALDQQVACSSSANSRNLPRANEVLCYRLDGSLQVLVVAPIMTLMSASGGIDDYWKLPKGNVDVTGEYFIWASNMGGSRLDMFIARVPLHQLGAAPAPAPAPAPSPTPEPEPEPTPTPTPAPASSAVPVTWVNRVNVSALSNTLTKSSGCDGCPDAGATSAEGIASGDGYLEITARKSGDLYFVGLGAGTRGTSPKEITFGLRMRNERAEVRETGMLRAGTTFADGDIFRIEVSNGRVMYLRNGVAFYTSRVTPKYPLYADTAMYSLGSAVNSAMLLSATTTTSPDPAPAPAPAPSPTPTPAPAPVPVAWTGAANVSITTSSITKVGGCDGCPDAGAVSTQAITSGDGYVEFTAGTGLQFIGLHNATQLVPGMNLAFALRLDTTRAEVRENGTYRSETVMAAGDRLRIAVVNGRIVYSRNGTVFYTSATSPNYPLRVILSMYSAGASLPTPTFFGS
jgi:hypothetical protein